MVTRLSVNLNKVALLRNQRDVGYPSVVGAAKLVIGAGADGITVHPRPDRRHIRPSDVEDLAAFVRTAPGIEFNIEGNPTPDLLRLVEAARPDQVTLVPDSPEQRTSDHGWDLAADGEWLAPIIAGLRARDIRVSLFMDPRPEAMSMARDCGADRVELYTESYASAFAAGDYAPILAGFQAAALASVESGLAVNAGHDLTLENLPAFKRAIPELAEVSIGHAITADALAMGFPAAVRAYLAALGR